MMDLPVLERLQIRNYGLYPGLKRDGVFDINLAPGLTVVLGANGLGKSTLVNILFRMLTGPWNVSLPDGYLGTANLLAVPLSPKSRSTFSARVNDAARDAEATIVFTIGARRFSVTRSLQKLDLVRFSVDDAPVSTDEGELKKAVLAASSIDSYGEWIFVLRTMVFFFEDRRMLVWDPTAQRQLLRCLFLEPAEARDWWQAEREILELDTRMRNLHAALSREEKEERKNQSLSKAAPEVRAELTSKETLLQGTLDRQAKLVESIAELDEARRRHRLDALRAAQTLHAAIHELERARLAAVEARYPSADESMRYIFSRLMTDDVCGVCQTPGRQEKRQQMLHAIDTKHCVLCDAKIEPLAGEPINLTDERISALRARVEEAKVTDAASRQSLDTSATDYTVAAKSLIELNTEAADLTADIEALVRQLPPDEQVARRQSDDMIKLKKRVEAMNAELQVKREAFAGKLATYRRQIGEFASQVKAAFDEIARGFLIEDVSLSWTPMRVQLGQAGTSGVVLTPIEYPSFSIEMTGANFSEVQRRDSPEQVSESQREFIDLAFRMALVRVGSQSQTSTIIIDAPESSLDAVFVNRAAKVLTSFANANSTNRLVVTSNLAAGKLIPAMLNTAESDPKARVDRIVDLFNAGVPTRAMTTLRAEYEELREELFTQIDASLQHASLA
ncbi:AAA family ATPase [Ralstonia pseudosolanacearum]|uniref:AAA family ATPase n=1 Tax=Ralstonia pseudosolanacearum TaxID=1310165 RepID=UPI001C8C2107|nr:AAA family ATPase [Ralstonia pseudosolanacearum]MBX9432256.1 AAA family ATPase [Ralstonia pseudosolanacearum]